MPRAEELMLCDSVYVKFNSQAEGFTGDRVCLNKGGGIDWERGLEGTQDNGNDLSGRDRCVIEL